MKKVELSIDCCRDCPFMECGQCSMLDDKWIYDLFVFDDDCPLEDI